MPETESETFQRHLERFTRCVKQSLEPGGTSEVSEEWWDEMINGEPESLYVNPNSWTLPPKV